MWACDTGFIVSKESLGSSKMLTLGRVGGMVASKLVKEDLTSETVSGGF